MPIDLQGLGDKDCCYSSEGKKALVMKQFLSDEKLEEIEEIIEMKITHRYVQTGRTILSPFHGM